MHKSTSIQIITGQKHNINYCASTSPVETRLLQFITIRLTRVSNGQATMHLEYGMQGNFSTKKT